MRYSPSVLVAAGIGFLVAARHGQFGLLLALAIGGVACLGQFGLTPIVAALVAVTLAAGALPTVPVLGLDATSLAALLCALIGMIGRFSAGNGRDTRFKWPRYVSGYAGSWPSLVCGAATGVDWFSRRAATCCSTLRHSVGHLLTSPVEEGN